MVFKNLWKTRKYYITVLQVRGSVQAADGFACIELAEYKTLKHVRWMQYQLRLLKNVVCFMSFPKLHLDKAGMWLFHHNTMQR